MFSSNLEFDSSTSFTIQLPRNNCNFSVHLTAKTRKIPSFSSWMEAWNIYLAVCIDHMPSWAPSLVAYQRIITSANTLHPLESWLHYALWCAILNTGSIQLYPTMEYLSSWSMAPVYNSSKCTKTRRWPCPYCSAVTHFHDHCPFHPYSSKQTPNRQWNLSRGQSD